MAGKLIFFLFLISVLVGQQKEITSSLQATESLRSFTKRTLGDAADWEIILKYNGYSSPDQVQPKARLLVPIGRYKTLTGLISQTNKTLQEASALGAGLLAQSTLAEATRARRRALNLKQNGDLTKATTEIRRALTEAKSAKNKTQAKRVQSVTAVLSEKKGTVQSKKQKEVRWANALEKQQLVEKERVRTLRNSYGQITLVDGSAISLGASSLAVIETMKENVITKTKQANIVILEGDVSSTLAALSKRNSVQVEVPGLKTDIRSTSFWASRDRNKIVRIANYNGEIDLESAGRSITLEENQGSKIVPGQAPSKPTELIAAPELASPPPKALMATQHVELHWLSRENAAAYQLQVSKTRNFSDLLLNQTVVRTRYAFAPQFKGLYYWRVAAIDSEELRGNFGRGRAFIFNQSSSKPYLRVEPFKSKSTRRASVELNGQTMPNFSVTANGVAVAVDNRGFFKESIELKTGKNEITVRATAPSGLTSTIRKAITFAPKLVSPLFSETSIFYTRQRILPLEHDLDEGEAVVLNGAVIAERGRVNTQLRLNAGSNILTFRKKDAAAVSRTLVLDTEKPEITVPFIPNYLAKSQRIRVESSEFATFSLNGEKLGSGSDIALDLPTKNGANTLKISAIDRAGNVSYSTISYVFDSTKPTLIRKRVVVTQTEFVVQIRAADTGSGLSETCQVELQSGKKTVRYFAKRLSGGNYELRLPKVGNTPKIIAIHLTDRAGNSRTE